MAAVVPATTPSFAPAHKASAGKGFPLYPAALHQRNRPQLFSSFRLHPKLVVFTKINRALLVFPNCKINLGLHITGKRPDGYHNLETVFYPVPLCDALEVIASPAPATDASAITFETSGLSVAGKPGDNLCVKAFELLRADFPQLPPILMHLHKAIPMGAGLGGGSADGAFALRLLNEKFELGLTRDHLLSYALRLGSDSPFFIINQPCSATGRGEILEPIELSLAGCYLVLINPGIHISTAQAFAGIRPAQPAKSIVAITSQPIETWKHELQNDFEPGASAMHPTIAAIKNQLYHAGAVYAAMSGTGSTVFGLFQAPPPDESSFASHGLVKVVELQ